MHRRANPWDRFYHYQKSPWRGERPIAALMPHISGPVLELGVGNGKLLRPLAAAGLDVVGLDVSFNVLSRLGTGVLADARWLPFADASFSTVMDVHCTGHLLATEQLEAFRESHRVLGDGGTLVLERLGEDDLRATQGEEMEPSTRRLEDGRTTHFASVSTLTAWLTKAGFEVINVDEVRRTPVLRGNQVTRHSVQLICKKQA